MIRARLLTFQSKVNKSEERTRGLIQQPDMVRPKKMKFDGCNSDSRRFKEFLSTMSRSESAVVLIGQVWCLFKRRVWEFHGPLYER